MQNKGSLITASCLLFFNCGSNKDFFYAGIPPDISYSEENHHSKYSQHKRLLREFHFNTLNSFYKLFNNIRVNKINFIQNYVSVASDVARIMDLYKGTDVQKQLEDIKNWNSKRLTSFLLDEFLYVEDSQGRRSLGGGEDLENVEFKLASFIIDLALLLKNKDSFNRLVKVFYKVYEEIIRSMTGLEIDFKEICMKRGVEVFTDYGTFKVLGGNTILAIEKYCFESKSLSGEFASLCTVCGTKGYELNLGEDKGYLLFAENVKKQINLAAIEIINKAAPVCLFNKEKLIESIKNNTELSIRDLYDFLFFSPALVDFSEMFQESPKDYFVEVHFNEYFESRESRFQEGDKKKTKVKVTPLIVLKMPEIIVQPLRIFVPKEGFRKCLDETKEDELYKKFTGKSQMNILEQIAYTYSESYAKLSKKGEVFYYDVPINCFTFASVKVKRTKNKKEKSGN